MSCVDVFLLGLNLYLMAAVAVMYGCSGQVSCKVMFPGLKLKASAEESYLLSQQPRMAVSSADSSRVRCVYREQNIYRI